MQKAVKGIGCQGRRLDKGGGWTWVEAGPGQRLDLGGAGEAETEAAYSEPGRERGG